MPKPRIFRGPAAVYESANERIMEFSNGGRGGRLLGGLLCVFEPEPGQLRIEIYRCDAGVEISTPLGQGTVVK